MLQVGLCVERLMASGNCWVVSHWVQGGRVQSLVGAASLLSSAFSTTMPQALKGAGGEIRMITGLQGCFDGIARCQCPPFPDSMKMRSQLLQQENACLETFVLILVVQVYQRLIRHMRSRRQTATPIIHRSAHVCRSLQTKTLTTVKPCLASFEH